MFHQIQLFLTIKGILFCLLKNPTDVSSNTQKVVFQFTNHDLIKKPDQVLFRQIKYRMKMSKVRACNINFISQFELH